MAQQLGLPTFDFALIDVTEDDELPFAARGEAIPGPAFITREELGTPWGGSPKELEKIANRHDIATLVLFDTWTLNCDRYLPDPRTPRVNRDNVFLSRVGAPRGKFILKAMDHTHCFTCGKDLTRRVSAVDRIQDARIYGLFDEFRAHLNREDMLDSIRSLEGISREDIECTVQTIPREWEVDQVARAALVELIYRRKSYVAELIVTTIWPQLEMSY